jgi:DNA-binding CsgD family transcriptional regulator
MFIEYLFFLATFIATTGLAVIGPLVSYQCFQKMKRPVFQILLYQQIFLFTFFIYGIWGNLAIREIISDIDLSAELENKLALFIPLIGTPFLMVSWFMLLKFGFNLNGHKFSRKVVHLYFSIFTAALLLLAVFVQTGKIGIPQNPDTAIVRLMVAVNFLIQLIFVYPFLRPQNNSEIPYRKNELQKTIALHFAGVVLYSGLLFFFGVFGFISTCLAILMLFAASVVLPLRFKFIQQEKKVENSNVDYQTFCSIYEISKRESEIIREICTGKTNKAIAEKLFITLQTVKDHTHRIYTKTNVKSRVQLANLVREKTGLKDF